MIKRMTAILLAVSIGVIFCLYLDADSLSDPAEENAGYTLLDSVFVTFKELAGMKEFVLEKTNEALDNMMRDAKKARAQNHVDDVFFNRFHRILMVLKIVITPIEQDGAGIMKPLYFGELNRFIEDIEGEKYDVLKAGSHEAIDKLSQAISHEIIDLRLYLDTKEKRDKLIDEYEKKIGLGQEEAAASTDQEKQLQSMRKITFINQAMTDYRTDYGVPPQQSGVYAEDSAFNKALSPFYIKTLPINDEWAGNYRVYTGKSCNGIYNGIQGCTDKDILIISYGRDGQKEDWQYDPQNPKAGLFEPKSEKDYDKDLVIWNGNWIRAPRIGRRND